MPQVDANFARGVCGESVKAAPSLGSANVPITSRPFVSPLYVDGRSVKKAIPEQLLAVSTISRSSCGLQLEAQRPPRGTIAPTRSTVINNYGDGRPDSVDNCPTIANPRQADCNNNGVGDACELAAGAPEFNADTIPDTCQCLADLFIDRQVNGADLGALLAFWGPVNPGFPQADMNADGKVDGADLGHLLASWGPCTN